DDEGKEERVLRHSLECKFAVCDSDFLPLLSSQEVKEDPTRPNEDPTRSKETMSTWKAGWVKKASGRFLASYKDRYIQVERTELVVYENEDLATYLEKVDLENYDKCHELRSAFTKKNRLVLIRAAKSGNKVSTISQPCKRAERHVSESLNQKVCLFA
ncbi:unnamed protein product, partial [Oncorhynchus mykiss]